MFTNLINLYFWITRKPSLIVYKDNYIVVTLANDGTVIYSTNSTNEKQQIRISDEISTDDASPEILVSGSTNIERGYIRFNSVNGIKTTIIKNKSELTSGILTSE